MIKKSKYYFGDFVSDNGPALVNKNYYSKAKNDYYIIKNNNKIIRVIHYFLCFIFIKTTLISGLSKFDYSIIKLSKLFNKKVVYMMHGDVAYESEINGDQCELLDLEQYIINNVDRIICVSKTFMEFEQNKYILFKNKFQYIYNYVGIPNLKYKKTEKSKIKIITVGGGTQRKNNLIVCEAIDTLIKTKKLDIEFTVIGNYGENIDKIKEYNFVKCIDNLDHDSLIKLFKESDIYIQNSVFETFGLCVVESFKCGCKIVISKEIGAKDVFENIDEYIVNDYNDYNEIKNVIDRVIKNKNKVTLKKEYNIDDIYGKLEKVTSFCEKYL